MSYLSRYECYLNHSEHDLIHTWTTFRDSMTAIEDKNVQVDTFHQMQVSQTTAKLSAFCV